MIIGIIFITIVFFNSCNLFCPKEELELKLEEASCTEVWLRVEGNKDSDMTLYCDDKEVKTFYFKGDTTIIDEGLQPNTEYSYLIFGKSYDKSSNTVTVVTMDTTSHEFTWEMYTLGDGIGGPSRLNDVAIINDTLAYAVGEIYQDYNKDYQIYNAAKWDGKTWELIRIPFIGTCSAVDYPPIKAIWAFSSTNILVTNGGSIVLYDGINATMDCRMNSLLTGTINKIWASNPNDIYAVGNSGTIVHYNEGSWKELESGTNTRLLDIYGDKRNIFIAGYEDFKPSVLLRYRDGILSKIVEEQTPNYNSDLISGGIKSVWVRGEKLYTLSLYDLFRSSTETNGGADAIWRGNPNIWGSNKVRGTEINDIVTVGNRGTLWHYNGVGWKNCNELYNYADQLLSVSVNEDILIAVGYRYISGIEVYGIIHLGVKKKS